MVEPGPAMAKHAAGRPVSLPWAEAANDAAVFREAASDVFQELGPRLQSLASDPELQRLAADPELGNML